MLDRHVLPALGAVKIAELDSYKVIAFLDCQTTNVLHPIADKCFEPLVMR
jgi:hypothetical protein